MTTFADHGIQIPGHASGGDVKTICPECSQQRRNSGDPCLSVNLDKGVWKCHHCGWSGGLQDGQSSNETHGSGNNRPYAKGVAPDSRKQSPKAPPAQPAYKAGVGTKWREYLRGRGITDGVIERNQLGERPFGNQSAITFPYIRNGEIVNVKRRTRDKRFAMEKGAELIPYGLDDIHGKTVALVCEGEIDKLSLEVAGFSACISVPNGAPNANEKNVTKRFEPLVNAAEWLDPLKEIILTVDNDSPGQRLEEELARRLGKHRCSRVRWPEGCKDANDVLVNFGADQLRECIERAEPFPIDDVITVADIDSDIDHLFNNGMPRGEHPGWNTVDKLFTVRPARLTLVTGVPSHGKSEWVESLLVNLTMRSQWRHAIFSPEHYPLAMHFMRLAEKLLGKTASNYNGFDKIGVDDLNKAKVDLGAHFFWIEPKEGEATLDGILGRATALVFRQGIRTLVIDPWNELEHERPANLSETEYVSKCLSKIKRWARTHDVHVFLIAHPTKMARGRDGKYPIPTPYDISGSANFRNKADNCITIWRELDGNKSLLVQIHVQKVKWKVEGRIGVAELEYVPATGRYKDGRVV